MANQHHVLFCRRFRPLSLNAFFFFFFTGPLRDYYNSWSPGISVHGRAACASFAGLISLRRLHEYFY